MSGTSAVTPHRMPWDWWLTQIEAYVRDNGNADIPTAATTTDGRRLGRWVDSARRRHRLETLPADQVAALEALPGWSWGNGHDERWWTTFDRLQHWVTNHDGRLPSRSDGADGGAMPLAVWAAKQRAAHRAGTLRADRVTALVALPGWVVSLPPSPPDWAARGNQLRDWVQHHPNEPITATSTGWSWVGDLRSAYRAGTLDDRIAAVLRELPGWSWTPVEHRWDLAYQALRAWIDDHPGEPVHQRHRHRGVAIGLWIGTQRRRHRTGELSHARVKKLEALPGWIWDARDATWWKHYNAVVASRLPAAQLRRPAVHQGMHIGAWAEAQRARHRAGKLDPRRARRLEALPGWRWPGQQ